MSSHRLGQSNERLEFLGDSVIGLIISESLWRRYPDDDEGSLTTRRAAIVSARGLSRIAQRLELGRVPVSGSGRVGGRRASAQVCARGPFRGSDRSDLSRVRTGTDTNLAAPGRRSRSSPRRTRSTHSNRRRASSRSCPTRGRDARRTTDWSATRGRHTRANTSLRPSSAAKRWARGVAEPARS